MSFRIDKYIKKIKSNLNSGDEISALDFIHNEIETIFPHLSSYDKKLAEKISLYRRTLDTNLQTFYSKRRDYEESVAILNNTIADYLDELQIEAQEMFPHYFEKYKTDGVEHGIYIGASLVNERKFDIIYLKNLRLWQLMVMCGAAKKTAELKSTLKIPLETSHLILVQDNPLSIRFRMDEKKFDVDGTYNLRYEIMKKRIDKAVIRGKKERLTQPEKIAIIYSQQKEANEYRRYIEYLQESGYILSGTEEYELEDLQGVHGLKALRVSVNTKSKSIGNEIKSYKISSTITDLNLVN
jgi:hypothetical protein